MKEKILAAMIAWFESQHEQGPRSWAVVSDGTAQLDGDFELEALAEAIAQALEPGPDQP